MSSRVSSPDHGDDIRRPRNRPRSPGLVRVQRYAACCGIRMFHETSRDALVSVRHNLHSCCSAYRTLHRAFIYCALHRSPSMCFASRFALCSWPTGHQRGGSGASRLCGTSTRRRRVASALSCRCEANLVLGFKRGWPQLAGRRVADEAGLSMVGGCVGGGGRGVHYDEEMILVWGSASTATTWRVLLRRGDCRRPKNTLRLGRDWGSGGAEKMQP